MTTLIIACALSASLGCAFGFVLGALIRGGSDSPKPTPPQEPKDQMNVTIRGLDRNARYDGETVERLIKLMEQRSADGQVFKIKVA